MTYVRNRYNGEDGSDKVAVKKSTLTAMGIALVILLGATVVLAWQNYQQNEHINALMNNRQVNTATLNSPAT